MAQDASPKDLVRGMFAALDAQNPAAITARMTDDVRMRHPCRDQLGYLDGAYARFGRSYTGPPDELADELSRDEAVLAADTLLLTIPNQLGADYNTRLLETHHPGIAPAIAGAQTGRAGPRRFRRSHFSTGFSLGVSTARRPRQVRHQRPVKPRGIALISHTNLLLALA